MAEIDHLALAVPDLEVSVERFEEEWGCRIHPGGRHPRWGSWNAILPLVGGIYLEIIAPHPEPPTSGRRVFGLDEIAASALRDWAIRPSPGGSGAERLVDLARSLGVELGEITRGSRRTPDGRLLQWELSDPFADRLGGAIPFVIDWGETPHPSETATPEVELIELRIEHPEPVRVERTLAALEIVPSVVVDESATPGYRARLATPRGEARLTGR